MKKIALSFLALTLLLGFSLSTACAEIYVSAHGALVAPLESDLFTAGIKIGTVTHQLGYGVVAAVGNDVDIFNIDGRAEVEFAYRVNSVDEASTTLLGTTAATGDVTSLSVMVNFLHDYTGFDLFTPFVGVGVGVAQVKGDVTIPLLGTASMDDATVAAGQAILGGSYAVTDQLDLELQYRFFVTGNEFYVNNVLGGLRYRF